MSEIKTEPLKVHMRSECMWHFVEGYQNIRRTIADEQLLYKDDVISGYMQVMAACWISALEETRNLQPYPQMSRQEQIYEQFIELVRQHYAVHRDVSFYADKICLTPKYLGVVVTQVSGRRPIDWIRDYVILDAKAMLLSGDYNIQEISEHLHFANPSFFGTYFKESVGCPPDVFAKNMQEKIPLTL